MASEIAAGSITAAEALDLLDDMLAILNNPNFVYTLTPEKVFVTTEFMHKIGMAKVKPTSWKEYFFAEAQGLPGN